MISESKEQTFAKVWRNGTTGFAILLAILALFYWIVCESWASAAVSQSFTTMQKVLPDLPNGAVVEQRITFTGNQLDELTIYPNVPQEVAGSLTAQVYQAETLLAQGELSLAGLANMAPAALGLGQAVIPGNTPLTLRLTVTRPEDGRFFSLFYGDTVDIGRYQIASGNISGMTVNGAAVTGHLDMALAGRNNTQTMTVYLYVAAGILLAYGAVIAWIARCAKQGKRNIFLIAADEIRRYRFLIERLVARDFNTKYRQSVLGVLWSFLNPLLTMAVYYFVFSTLFKNNIPNFVAYLLTGIVFFNFFGEATNMGLESITSNASLINKVYVPKYVYPFSRVISSLVNLAISLIPLLAVVILTGLPVTKAFLLLPLPILFLTAFSLGMSLLLATSNVFFRDTKFLWGVLVMMWNFLTPIFYPESIIPANLLQLYHINPMYQFVYFLRCILMEGVTPQPVTYLYCVLCSLVPLLLGLWAFRKNQNKFVLYL